MEEMWYVFLFAFFTLPLIFTLVAAGGSSNFLTAALKEGLNGVVSFTVIG